MEILMSLELILASLQNEYALFGGEGNAHASSLVSVAATMTYYCGYFFLAKYFRKKSIIRNPEVERVAYEERAITQGKLLSRNLEGGSNVRNQKTVACPA